MFDWCQILSAYRMLFWMDIHEGNVESPADLGLNAIYILPSSLSVDFFIYDFQLQIK